MIADFMVTTRKPSRSLQRRRAHMLYARRKEARGILTPFMAQTRDGLLMGRVNFGGILKDACLAYIPEIQLGDYVIVHVGFAISRVDEEEALKTLEILATMGDMVRAELATMGPGMDEPAVVSDDGTPGTGAFGGISA